MLFALALALVDAEYLVTSKTFEPVEGLELLEPVDKPPAGGATLLEAVATAKQLIRATLNSKEDVIVRISIFPSQPEFYSRNMNLYIRVGLLITSKSFCGPKCMHDLQSDPLRIACMVFFFSIFAGVSLK